MVEVGQKAPDFTLSDTQKNETKLSSFQGQNVVLFFFPKAFTGTCERQISAHHHEIAKFRALDAQVLGVSTDQSPAQAAFIKACGVDSFPVLSDFRHQVINLYGIARAEGQIPNERATFILDKSGTLRYKHVEPDSSKWAGVEPELKVLEELTK